MTREVDILNDEMSGVRLIEAGAGTGKTYAIANYFLRLTLEKGLRPDQILVVTFTKAATQELRERIRGKLRLALDVSRNGPGGDAESREVAAILEKFGGESAGTRLESSLRDFDEASIYTIHGFCQRALREFAFESGARFDVEALSSQKEMLDDVVNDFWRGRVPSSPMVLVRYAANNGFSHGKFRKFVDDSRAVSNPNAPLEPGVAPRNETEIAKTYGDAMALHRKYMDAFKRFSSVLNATDEEVLNAWFNDKLIKKSKNVDLLFMLRKFAAEGLEDFTLFEKYKLRRYTRAAMEETAAGKKKGAPNHALIDACEELRDAAESLTELCKDHFERSHVELIHYVRENLPKLKELRNAHFYDDLVLSLRNSLDVAANRERAAALRTALRKKYRAALIDEFQDTDEAQYDIFKNIFGEGVLYLIGDPKQAIYSFRGADVFTYMKAKNDAGEIFHLSRNRRSAPRLVRAVNEFFSGDGVARNESGEKSPFLYDLIPFENAEFVEEKEASTPVENGESIIPMRMTPLELGAKLPVAEARKRCAEASAKEILRLLLSGTTIDGERLRPSDFAILTQKHSLSTLSLEALRALEIPATVMSQDSVFGSKEARELRLVLEAVASPSSERYARAALTTDFFGVDAPRLRAMMDDPEAWESRLNEFHEFRKAWADGGFSAMFRRMLLRDAIPQRAARFPDGKRRLTNLLHLAELLNREENDRGLAPAELLTWLSEQCANPSRDIEEQQLRLEGDENAVRISTIHASKGLEYPIVFLPYLWDMAPKIPKPDAEKKKDDKPIPPFAAHDRANRLLIHLGLPCEERYERLVSARREELGEIIRQAYVALTRAKNACHVYWGDVKGADSSPLVGLLHGPGAMAADEDPYRAIKKCFDAKTGKDRAEKEEDDKERKPGGYMEDLKSIADRKIIELRPETGAGETLYSAAEAEGAPLEPREFPRERKIDASRFVSSFSHLTADRGRALTHDGEPRDLDAGSGAVEEGVADAQPSGIFAFPRGIRAGLMLHSLLEDLDFRADEAAREALAERKIRDFGVGTGRLGDVTEMLKNLLEAPILGDDFTLSQLSPDDRVNELEFCHPLPRLEPESVAAVYRRFAAEVPFGDFPERAGRIRFDAVEGYMKGFMDMAFRRGEKYYIVDWKSNHLGNALEDYNRPGLARAMAEGMYVLQYHIYTVALNRFLRLRVPGYSYEKNFGGAVYVFLRGVDRRAGADYGFFRDRPAEALIRNLEEALCGPSMETAR